MIEQIVIETLHGGLHGSLHCIADLELAVRIGFGFLTTNSKDDVLVKTRQNHSSGRPTCEK